MESIKSIVNENELPIVASVGFFDGVHLGHKYLIEQIKEEAEKSQYESAIITFTEHPQKVLESSFHPYLLTPFSEKINLLKETGIDYCIPLKFTKDLAGYSAFKFMEEVLLKRYNVRTLIIGYDHRFGNNRSEGFDEYVEYGEKLGIKIIKAKPYEQLYVSSSQIRRDLAEGKLDEANKLLDYNYFLKGEVVHGLKIARTLGYPTANLQLSAKDSDKMLPAFGVYAAWTYLNGKKYASMVYLGRRPTMLNNGGMTIETHLINFDGDLYGKILTVEFLKYMREEMKFTDKKHSKQQIKKDFESVKDYFENIED